jgi:large subunit ribosomal protein L32
MANPKRRWSKARTGKRRSQWKLKVPNLVECPRCHNLMMSHRVCSECGYYKGREVLKVVKEKKK